MPDLHIGSGKLARSGKSWSNHGQIMVNLQVLWPVCQCGMRSRRRAAAGFSPRRAADFGIKRRRASLTQTLDTAVQMGIINTIASKYRPLGPGDIHDPAQTPSILGWIAPGPPWERSWSGLHCHVKFAFSFPRAPEKARRRLVFVVADRYNEKI